MVKEEISENIVKVRRKSDRVIKIVLTLDREVIQIIFSCGPQSRTLETEKVHFDDKMTSEWNLESFCEITISLGDFNGREELC